MSWGWALAAGRETWAFWAICRNALSRELTAAGCKSSGGQSGNGLVAFKEMSLLRDAGQNGAARDLYWYIVKGITVCKTENLVVWTVREKTCTLGRIHVNENLII